MTSTQPDRAFQRLIYTAPAGWKALKVLSPDETSQYQDRLTALADSAGRLGLATLDAVVSAASDDLAVLAGAGATPTDLHRTRNLLAALCCTTQLEGDPRGYRLLAALPRLDRRTMLVRGRPLFDDERLVMRLVVTCRLRRGPKHYMAAARYVLTEIGDAIGEATAIYVRHLDDPRHPTCIRAPGNQVRAGRELDLDDWQSEVLGLIATNQATHGDLSKPLAYDGGQTPGGYTANVSCHRSLDNLLDEAGLGQQKDVTASSITFSAADRIERSQGREAAVLALGRTKGPESLREERAGQGPPTLRHRASHRLQTSRPKLPYRTRLAGDTCKAAMTERGRVGVAPRRGERAHR